MAVVSAMWAIWFEFPRHLESVVVHCLGGWMHCKRSLSLIACSSTVMQLKARFHISRQHEFASSVVTCSTI